MMLFNNCLRC